MAITTLKLSDEERNVIAVALYAVIADQPYALQRTMFKMLGPIKSGPDSERYQTIINDVLGRLGVACLNDDEPGWWIDED